MERVTVFSIHSISPESRLEQRTIHGRALDNVMVGSKLYYSDSVLDTNYCIVEAVESETKSVSSLGIMQIGAIIINIDEQNLPDNQFLYNEAVNNTSRLSLWNKLSVWLMKLVKKIYHDMLQIPVHPSYKIAY
jgi:hypothetical protein